LASVVMVMGGASLVATQAQASTTSAPINVPCSGTNGGAAGLVAAVNQANQSGGGTIVLAARCNYQLTAAVVTGANGPDGLPLITTAITIEGNGAAISGNGSPYTTNQFRLLEVTTTGTLSAANLTIQEGGSLNPGAGILNDGSTTLTNATVQNNETTVSGGAIANNGGLRVVGSTISGSGLNIGSVLGGGLYNTGQATLSQTVVTGNAGHSGGGIANSGQLTLSGSAVTSNTALDCVACHGAGYGGGLYNTGGTATLISTTVASNFAGGPDASSQGFGGGIYVAGGTVTLAGGVVAANTPDNCDPPGSVTGCVG
jgi:hypothetical protein